MTHVVLSHLADMKPVMNQHDCIKEIKDVQNYQMDQQGWTDIGFNFLICNANDGQQRIYKGRGWTYVGAHCVGHNYNSLGKIKFYFQLC